FRPGKNSLQSRGRGWGTVGIVVASACWMVVIACGADGSASPDLEAIARRLQRLIAEGLSAFGRMPPSERIAWGGLVAAAILGLGVIIERTARLRRRGVIPPDFATRFLERLQEGRLDRGKALDFCELNPSPASRVALAAVRRWGRPLADLERAVALAHQVEASRLACRVGTLRRIAAL